MSANSKKKPRTLSQADREIAAAHRREQSLKRLQRLEMGLPVSAGEFHRDSPWRVGATNSQSVTGMRARLKRKKAKVGPTRAAKKRGKK